MPTIATLVFFVLAVAGCSSSTSTSTPADETPEPEIVVIVPGGSALGAVTIDETELTYVTITPADFAIGDGAPVLLAFPPGRQDEDITVRFTTGTYEAEAVKRGWVVVSPVAPNGTLFFDGSEEFVPGLVEWINSWVDADGGTLHVTGASNGGLSAFRSVGLYPELFASIVVFPGYPFTAADEKNIEEFDGPIRMFVGADDSGWVEPMEEVFKRLSDQNADVSFEAFPGAGHTIEALADGVRLFDELGPLR